MEVAVSAAVSRQSGSGTAGSSRRRSQLRVKAGVIRPPMTAISIITQPKPARQPSPCGTGAPIASPCIRRFARPRIARGARSG